MSMTTLINAFGAYCTRIHSEDGKLIEQTSVDVEPILESVAAAREANATHGGHRMSRNLVPVAEIPATEYVRACRLGVQNDPAYWRRWANAPENKVFRITKGRL
jgi:hypothetical protein